MLQSAVVPSVSTTLRRVPTPATHEEAVAVVAADVASIAVDVAEDVVAEALATVVIVVAVVAHEADPEVVVEVRRTVVVLETSRARR